MTDAVASARKNLNQPGSNRHAASVRGLLVKGGMQFGGAADSARDPVPGDLLRVG